jgi:hypothetical protein
MPRTCYYTNAGFAQEVDGKIVYNLAQIEEGVPGYRVTHSDPDLDVVQQLAREGNETAGLSDEDVQGIVISSVTAGPVRS